MSSEFLFRVKRSYRLALESNKARGAGRIWSKINRMRADIHAALLNDSDGPLRKIFSAPAKTDLFYGTDFMARSVLDPKYFDSMQRGFAELCRSDIALLHRVIMQSEEHDPEAALSSIDARLNQTIKFPAPIEGEFGLSTSRGLASFRAIQAIYQAWRILELTNGKSNPAILEIGPGLGRTAYYCYQAGLTDFTTIDLPLGVVAQAFFLANALGHDRIWLLGDDPEQAAGRIKLLPAGHPLGRFDLVANVDSLVEMPLTTIIEYLQLIAKSEALFLSINHGIGNFTVEEVVRIFFPGSQANTKPYPMREGYAESCFKLGTLTENTRALRLRCFFARCAGAVRYRCRNFFKSYGLRN